MKHKGTDTYNITDRWEKDIQDGKKSGLNSGVKSIDYVDLQREYGSRHPLWYGGKRFSTLSIIKRWNNFEIIYFYPTSELLDKLKEEKKELYIKEYEGKFAISFSGEWGEAKEEQRKLINLIAEFDSAIIELKPDLFSTLEIDFSLKIFEQVRRGKFSEAIQDAINLQANNECYKTVWQLCNYFNENPPQEIEINLFNLYKSISENNPYYNQANERLFVLYSLDVANFSPNEKTNHLEKQLDFALKSGQQNLIDHTYNRLCGYREFQIKFSNVSGSLEMLIATAAKIRKDKEKKQQLKNENSSLKKMNLFLEKEILSLKEKSLDDKKNNFNFF